jgi:hypothetical protein
MITFELHTLKSDAGDNQWKLTAVFEDIELARHDATRMDESKRYAGIRLVEEKHNEVTGKTESKTVFRGGVKFNAAKDRSLNDPVRPARDVEKSLAHMRQTRGARGGNSAAARTGGMSSISILLLSLVFGVAALYALYEFVPD